MRSKGEGRDMKKIFLAYLMGSFMCIYPCMVTLYNDGRRPIQVTDHNSMSNKNADQGPTSFAIIPQKSSRRIGTPHEHAHFTVYIKHPKHNTFIAAYEVKQNECNKTGNPFLKLSDLKNKTGEANLFTITDKSRNHTSMVRQLPSIQRAEIYKGAV